jgi:ATP-dependent protease Clp ATPase subunit
MNYEEFDGETREYIDKAMEIYYVIKDEEIIRTVKDYGKEKQYQFTKFDKKILALFIAVYMVEGKLKDIFEEYDDIRLRDLLTFTKAKTKSFDKLPDGKYKEFYEKFFKLDLRILLDEKSNFYNINRVDSGVIASCLCLLDGRRILGYFFDGFVDSAQKLMFVSDHPLFKAIETYNFTNGSVEKKSFSKSNESYKTVDKKKFDFGNNDLPKGKVQMAGSPIKDFRSEAVWAVLDDVQKKFIGQETAAEELFYNIVNNQQLAQMDDVPDGQRSIMFLDGPTGTGKTAITREITERLGVPFTSTSVTNYSSTGYVGGDITDVLRELYKKTGGDLERAQCGIVVFDEFDKIAYSRSGGLEMKRAVQQQLLDFMGGGKYKIPIGDSIFDRREVEFDTSKLTFICLGALTDLREQKTTKKQQIGFGQSDSSCESQDYTITPQDLMGIGLERELVGRFNTYLHTNDYSREALVEILKKSDISPLIGFRKWVESNGKTLKIDEEVYGLIADYAYELNTGARSLQTVVNNLRTPFIKEVLRGNGIVIHLDAETVKKICGRTTKRNRRV